MPAQREQRQQPAPPPHDPEDGKPTLPPRARVTDESAAGRAAQEGRTARKPWWRDSGKADPDHAPNARGAEPGGPAVAPGSYDRGGQAEAGRPPEARHGEAGGASAGNGGHAETDRPPDARYGEPGGARGPAAARADYGQGRPGPGRLPDARHGEPGRAGAPAAAPGSYGAGGHAEAGRSADARDSEPGRAGRAGRAEAGRTPEARHGGAGGAGHPGPAAASAAQGQRHAEPGGSGSSAEAPGGATAETQAQVGAPPTPAPPAGKLAGAAAAARKAGAVAAGFGRGSARLGRGAVRRIRRVTHAQGAGETGLGRMIELHAFSNGGDAAMAVGLAGTLFFTVPSAEARGNVALYLALTMAPFAVLAPLIGPFLDRFRRGRRWAIGSTLAVRAFFCWVVAGALATEQWYLYPLVLGCLVASKAYNVTRASAVPRLLPPSVPLVTANSRISLAGTIGAGLFAAIAGGLSFIGPDWALRWAFVVFIVGTILAIRLPARVDSSEGEENVGMAEVAGNRHKIPAVVVLALRANAAFRALAGFLLMFMAFLLRQHPLPGVPTAAQVGIVAGAAGVGAFAGTSLGALTRDRLKRPEIVVIVLLALVTVTAAVASVLYGLIAVAVFALVTGVCQQLGKLSLDALIQREVPEHVRTGVFSRSETVLQLAWVLGGGLGIVLPLIPALGMGVCAAGLAIALVFVLRTRVRIRETAATQPAAAAPAERN
ncbi:hypothetical protein GCM10027569_23350 [Flindersiella endophytica]